MAIEDYKEATKYENLIRIAFKCERGNRYGAHLSYMENAITMERGETYAKHLGSFNKQFEKVKKHISKALTKLSKTKAYSSQSQFFNELNNELNTSNSTGELKEIVKTSLAKLTELRK